MTDRRRARRILLGTTGLALGCLGALVLAVMRPQPIGIVGALETPRPVSPLVAPLEPRTTVQLPTWPTHTWPVAQTAPTVTTTTQPPTTTTTVPVPTTSGFVNLDDVVRSQADWYGYNTDVVIAQGHEACARFSRGQPLTGLGNPNALGIAVGILCPEHYEAALAAGMIAAQDLPQ
jgi:hypothetical protein